MVQRPRLNRVKDGVTLRYIQNNEKMRIMPEI